LTLAVLNRRLIQQGETEASFVFIIFVFLLGKTVSVVYDVA